VIASANGSGRFGVHSPIARGAALVLICAVAYEFGGALELRMGPELWTQPWRLWTAHLVHANAMHFALDVGACVVLLALGAPARSFLWLAPVVALGVAALRPELSSYVGLSGVLHGWFVLIVLRTARPGRLRTALLVGVIGKAVLEMLSGTTSLGGLDVGATPVPEAHLIGALAATAGAYWASLSRRRRAVRSGTHAKRSPGLRSDDHERWYQVPLLPWLRVSRLRTEPRLRARCRPGAIPRIPRDRGSSSAPLSRSK